MGNRYWSKEEKLRIIKRVLEDYESTHDVSKSENIDVSKTIFLLTSCEEPYCWGVGNKYDRIRKRV